MENKKLNYQNIYNKGDFVTELKYKDFKIKKNDIFIKIRIIDDKSNIFVSSMVNKSYDDVRELSI